VHNFVDVTFSRPTKGQGAGVQFTSVVLPETSCVGIEISGVAVLVPDACCFQMAL
jgi:hypothetical protein